MNARYILKSVATLTMISMIAVGCSGGNTADETPQFQSPTGRSITPSTNTSIDGNDDASDHQEILDAIQGSTEAANAAKAAADAAKTAAEASKTASEEAKMKAEEASENSKKAASKADKAASKANLAAWVAGIGSALAIITSGVGDRIVHNNTDREAEKLKKDADEKHQEDLSAHAGTQGVAARNQELALATGAVVAKTREDQLLQGDQLSSIGQNSADAAAAAEDASNNSRNAARDAAYTRNTQVPEVAKQVDASKNAVTARIDAARDATVRQVENSEGAIIGAVEKQPSNADVMAALESLRVQVGEFASQFHAQNPRGVETDLGTAEPETPADDSAENADQRAAAQ